MKKFLMIALMSIVSFAAFAQAQHTQCLLHHEGKATMYSIANLTAALDAAVEGDTLYLPTNTVSGFTLTKAITVMGAGDQKTTISGDIIIAIPSNPTLCQTLLEGLYITGNVTLKTKMNGVAIKQCHLNNYLYVEADNDNISLDRCFVFYYREYSYTKGIKVNNSKIRYFSYVSNSTRENCLFTNCNIGLLSSGYNSICATFVNCIIDNADGNSARDAIPNSSFLNCALCYDIYSYYSKQNCITFRSNYDNLNSSLEPLMSEDWMNEYLGTDGTHIGAAGGATPYTLTLNIPKVNESEITHDAAAKQLNVKIKVSAK